MSAWQDYSENIKTVKTPTGFEKHGHASSAARSSLRQSTTPTKSPVNRPQTNQKPYQSVQWAHFPQTSSYKADEDMIQTTVKAVSLQHGSAPCSEEGFAPRSASPAPRSLALSQYASAHKVQYREETSQDTVVLRGPLAAVQEEAHPTSKAGQARRGPQNQQTGSRLYDLTTASKMKQ